MILTPLALTPDHDIPGPVLTELTALYASHRAFHALSGDFPDPEDIRPEQVATALADELARPGAEVLLARDAGRLVGVAVTLARHPDPSDPDPWIGLLMVDAGLTRQGHGSRLVSLVEDRFRAAGRTAVRLAVLDGNTDALSFWTALGYRVLDHRRDLGAERPCTVLRRELASDKPRTRAAPPASPCSTPRAPSSSCATTTSRSACTGRCPAAAWRRMRTPARAPCARCARRPAGPTWNRARCSAPGNTTSPT